ncbi:hypothetical protein C8J57DRAFT_1718947, partial [Mycena rebaudengoi]
ERSGQRSHGRGGPHGGAKPRLGSASHHLLPGTDTGYSCCRPRTSCPHRAPVPSLRNHRLPARLPPGSASATAGPLCAALTLPPADPSLCAAAADHLRLPIASPSLRALRGPVITPAPSSRQCQRVPILDPCAH